MFTIRNYLLVGIVVGALTYLLMSLFGADVAAWARDLMVDARAAGAGGFGELVGQPIVTMGENALIAAGIMVILWPFALLWGLMTGIVLLIIVLA